jgi:hypothetical protein
MEVAYTVEVDNGAEADWALTAAARARAETNEAFILTVF